MLPASWSQIALQWELNPNFATSERGQVYEWVFRPSMKALSLQVYGRKVRNHIVFYVLWSVRCKTKAVDNYYYVLLPIVAFIYAVG